MAEVIDFQIKVGADGATKSVGSLKSQLREAIANVDAMNQKFGVTSKEAIAAAKQAGALKDRIADLKDQTDAFNPDKKFQAFSQALSAVTGGFAAVQGAMGLLGVESDEVQKQLLKVQSAMALSQGLTTVLASGDAFKNLAGVIKTNAVSAFNSLRNAIGGTGIGLLVIAVGALVANFDSIKKVLTDTFPILNDMGKTFDRLKQIAFGLGNTIIQYVLTPFKALGKVLKGDIQGAIDEVKNGLAFSKNFAEGAQKEIDRQGVAADKKRQEDRIKANEDLLKEQQAAGKKTFDLELQILKDKQDLFKDDNKKLAEFLLDERVLRARHNRELSDEAARAAAKQKQDFEKRQAEFKREQEENRKNDLERLSDTTLTLDERIRLQSEALRKETATRVAAANQEISDNEAKKQVNLDIQREEFEAKIQFLDDIANATAGLTALLGEETAAGKALAIATTTIDTWIGAQKAFNSQFIPGDPTSPARAALAAAGSVIAGLARVKKIVSVKVPGRGSGGGGVGGGGGITGASTQIQQTGTAPLIPQGTGQQRQVQQTNETLNQLNQTLKGGITANVLEGQVVGTLGRSSTIQQGSEL